MNDVEADRAFNEAVEQWEAAGVEVADIPAARYFFFAGAELGSRAVAKILEDIYGEPV
jgi:hypothetical protein